MNLQKSSPISLRQRHPGANLPTLFARIALAGLLMAGTANAAITVGTALPQGIVGQPYLSSLTATGGMALGPAQGPALTFTLTATGGTAPYSFTALAGLPAGLILSSTGTLSGTPTQSGTFNVLLRTTDALGNVVESTLPLTVATASFRFTLNTLPNAFVNQAYSQTLATAGNTGNVSFSLQSGSLPTGLTLTPTGIISGTPSTNGTFAFTVRAVDSANVTITAPFTLTVTAATVSFSTSNLPSGTVGQGYEQQRADHAGWHAGPL